MSIHPNIRESCEARFTVDGVEHLSVYAITSDAKLLRKFGSVSDHPDWWIAKRGFFDAQWEQLRTFLGGLGFTVSVGPM